ncbi:hypothetical protein [Bacillus phage CP-51]|uniref:Uncharacterized protein n=1 Tax=Bacillus phage CP-51 TaxID=1391188 RepID=A0A068EM90_9CAUD|nr:hypothetical protein OZ73_gp008 [Bacillus phage CP-51]AID50443.1 hypothetical protein [Bacillus phage CP-51]
MAMTKVQLITGIVYTEEPVSVLRSHLQGGVKTGTFIGYTDENKTEKVIVAVHAMEYIFTK